MNVLDEEKLFYERFWALHRNPDLVEVLKRFGIGVFRRSSVLEGFADFLSDNNVRGKTCVEIGTCKGLTAIVLSRFFERVISIDIVADEERKVIADHVGANNINFITVENNAHKAAVINGLIEFDAAYVDGDHARDTESDFELVRRAGRVVFHEHWAAQPDVLALVQRERATGNVATKGKLALWTAF